MTIIRKNSLEKLFQKLKTADKLIYAPVKNGDKVDFEELVNYNDFAEDYIQTTQSVKSVVFPRYEKILKYKKDGDAYIPEEIDLSSFRETVLFGVHPCDAAAFAVLNSVFTWEFKDTFFTERLNKITIIGLSCAKFDEYCFCTSVGINPSSVKESDILLTKLKSGDYLAEIITEKGKAVYELASELFEESNNINKEENIADVPVKFNAKQVTEKLTKLFDSPLWIKQSLRCLGCGACAYVCPACSCFDLQDENRGKETCRVKCWDNCGFSQFTIHTSGHNPRDEQYQRWRQRVLHKFLYQPDRLQIYGCVGCGRCSRACPVDMNLQEHMTTIDNEQ